MRSLHSAVVAAVAFAILFTWPLVAFDRPGPVALGMYIAWAACIGLLYGQSRTVRRVGGAEADDA